MTLGRSISRVVGPALAALLVVSAVDAAVGCGTSGDSGDESAEGGTCSAEIVSATDGTTTCAKSAASCAAGFHCDTGSVACLTGCTRTANCGANEYCDLSGATRDEEGTVDGVCRTPEATCLGFAAPDASMTLDEAGTKPDDASTRLDASLDAAADSAPDADSGADAGSDDSPCGQLQVCCHAIKDVDEQNKCEAVVATVSTVTCMNALAMYEADGECP